MNLSETLSVFAHLRMKAGRPAYHVRSKWLTVATPDGILYFELDTKGNLVKNKIHQLIPHHIGELQLPTIRPAVVTPPDMARADAPAAPIAAPIRPPPAVSTEWLDLTPSWFQDDSQSDFGSAEDSSLPDLSGLCEGW
jgi:hypothetical protein